MANHKRYLNFSKELKMNATYRASWLKAIFAGLCLLIAGGSTHAQTVTATVNAGKLPLAVGVNPATNKAYIANSGDNTVTAIDGSTNIATPITVGTAPSAVGVNPVTNLIYVANNNNGGAGTVSVINGSTNTVVGTINVGTSPIAVAVNPVTNKIYVANQGSGNVTVIDGNNVNPTVTVGVGSNPVA